MLLGVFIPTAWGGGWVGSGVLHVFHQFGQCGWAHALSYDGAHWKNVRNALTPDLDPSHSYDQCGCFDGSLTFAPGVNHGAPVILYAPQPSVPAGGEPLGNATTSVTAPGPELTSGDRPVMAVARPSNLADPELQRWVKDPKNPVNGVLSDMGQIWANGNRWDGLSDGALYSTIDPTLHSWTRQPKASGFPRGGSGGQWFQQLPPLLPGAAMGPPSGSLPTHLVSTGNGQVYTAGWYSSKNETWKTAIEGLLLDSGQIDGRNSYTWATLQCSGSPRRCFSVGWLVPAAGPQPGPRSPNSALSLVREVFWEAETGGSLIKRPMPELELLRNGTLYQSPAIKLEPAVLFSPPLPTGAGDTIDVEASFEVDGSSVIMFGLAVLANSGTTLDSAVINVTCRPTGACTANGGIEHPKPPPTGALPPVPPPWPGSRLVNLSRMMPHTTFPGGSLTGDATVPSVAYCQKSCDELPLCQTWSAFTVTNGTNWRCTLKAAVEKTGCPVVTFARSAISGAKVAGQQRCSSSPHGFVAPRLDWSQDFMLPKNARAVDVRILVDRSIVEVFISGGRVAAVMPYQPPNDVANSLKMDLANFTGVHLFAEQPQLANLTIHQMGCGWNQSVDANGR